MISPVATLWLIVLVLSIAVTLWRIAVMRIADDFAAIRRRLDEIRDERPPADHPRRPCISCNGSGLIRTPSKLGWQETLCPVCGVV